MIFATTSDGVSCGQCSGRLDRSRSPANPSAWYRRIQVQKTWRLIP
jgi:hypothetical protein